MKAYLKGALAVLACTAGIAAHAQKNYPRQEPMTPGMSEYWTPQPAVVAPGDSRTNGAPSDAVVLFDGSDLSAWTSAGGGPAEWPVHDGVFTVDKSKGDILTKRSFENFQLHLEWCVPEGISGESQSRGNSGVFLQDKYEIQILDGYRNETYVNGQVGSVYKQTPPLVNAMRRPDEWNVFDIIYSAPVFKEDGSYRIPPHVTVILNGVVLQNNTTILGTTEYVGFPRVVKHGAGPLRLQSHGDPSEPISFRNIWIREL